MAICHKGDVKGDNVCLFSHTQLIVKICGVCLSAFMTGIRPSCKSNASKIGQCTEQYNCTKQQQQTLVRFVYSYGQWKLHVTIRDYT